MISNIDICHTSSFTNLKDCQFNDIKIFYEQIRANELIGKDELKRTFEEFENPEMINDTRETSASYRLMRIINRYNKIVYGNILADAIGLENIRNKSNRFNRWLQKLKMYNDPICSSGD